MKTKFYWVALLASAALIGQANAGGRYGGGGGGSVARVAPERAAVPSFNSAASGSFGSGRMVYSGQRFSPTTLRSPSSPAVRQYYIMRMPERVSLHAQISIAPIVPLDSRTEEIAR